MIELSLLARWSDSPVPGGRYLRPLVCRGSIKGGGAAIVGVNPATAIGPTDIAFEKYLNLLLDASKFEEFYQDLRVKRGKSPTSRTRMGLRGLACWLMQLGHDFVAETNVAPYPTCSSEALYAVPLEHQSRWVFREVVHKLSPRLLVLHGEDALQEFTSSTAPHLQPKPGTKFTDLIKSPRLGEVIWPNGMRCEIYVCSHLRYFGKAGGQRFVPLKQALGV